MFGLKKDAGTHIRLVAPELGRRREPSPHLRAHRRGVDNVLAEVMRIERTADGAGSRLLASQLAEATVTLLGELTGEDFSPVREKLASHAHLGCSVALAEDLSDGCAVGLTEPHVDTALLYLSLENKVADELMKALTDWMMEAGYYLRRTGREVVDVVPSLRADMERLFPTRITPVVPVVPVVQANTVVPSQRHSAQAAARRSG